MCASYIAWNLTLSLFSLKVAGEGNGSSRQPIRTINEIAYSVSESLLWCELHTPPNSVGSIGTRTSVGVLTISDFVSGVLIPIPQQPTSRFNQAAQCGLNEHGPGIWFPWPTQVSGPGGSCWNSSFQCTGKEGEPGWLCWIRPATRRVRVLWPVKSCACQQLAVLENSCRISEDVVHCAQNGTIRVELSQSVSIQSVLQSILIQIMDQSQKLQNNLKNS
jgi:hypothetical protein